MAKFNDMVYGRVLRAINDMVPYKEADYENMVIASAFAKGHREKLTADWLRKSLLMNVEDEFMTYGQALVLEKVYTDAIAKLNMMF